MALVIDMTKLTAYERRAIRRRNRTVNPDDATRPTDEVFLQAQLAQTLEVLVKELMESQRGTAEPLIAKYLQATPEKQQAVDALLRTP